MYQDVVCDNFLNFAGVFYSPNLHYFMIYIVIRLYQEIKMKNLLLLIKSFRDCIPKIIESCPIFRYLDLVC